MKNELQPIRAPFSSHFQRPKALCCLSKSFSSFWYWNSVGTVEKPTLYFRSGILASGLLEFPNKYDCCCPQCSPAWLKIKKRSTVSWGIRRARGWKLLFHGCIDHDLFEVWIVTLFLLLTLKTPDQSKMKTILCQKEHKWSNYALSFALALVPNGTPIVFLALP